MYLLRPVLAGLGCGMSNYKIEIKKVYSEYERKRRSSWWGLLFWPKLGGMNVIGYDYYIDGTQVAAARWDGRKLITSIAPEYNGLFGLTA